MPAKKKRPAARAARAPAVSTVSAAPKRPPWNSTRTIGSRNMTRPTVAGMVTNAIRRSAKARLSLNGPRSGWSAWRESSGRMTVAIDTAKPPSTSSFKRFA